MIGDGPGGLSDRNLSAQVEQDSSVSGMNRIGTGNACPPSAPSVGGHGRTGLPPATGDHPVSFRARMVEVEEIVNQKRGRSTPPGRSREIGPACAAAASDLLWIKVGG